LPGLAAGSQLIFANIPLPLPPNLVSLGYEPTSTAEFGGMLELAQENYPLYSAQVVMSNWAFESEWEPLGTSAGFQIPLTLNIYAAGAGNAVGPLIASSTVNALIPWRPEPDPTCGGTAYRAADGNCHNGSASIVVFHFSGVTLPQQIIYGLAYNTEHHGYSPVGTPGPYNSLAFALSTVAPSVGTLPLPGTVYWNTSSAGFYADGGAGGSGVFRQDTGWNMYSGAIGFATPEPVSYLLCSAGLLMLGLVRRRTR
jgi:hypothetical protein